MNESRIILADNQFITREGIRNLLSGTGNFILTDVYSKKELMAELTKGIFSIIVLDYTLFDFGSSDELFNLSAAYPDEKWMLFSSELSDEFVRRAYYSSPNFSFLNKESSENECRAAFIEVAVNNRRYICSAVSNMLLDNMLKQKNETGQAHLTASETEILKEIASGKTTREIAGMRHSSIHTIISHRKNIFRKIEVNNVYEATKYAVKAGLIDLSDYFI